MRFICRKMVISIIIFMFASMAGCVEKERLEDENLPLTENNQVSEQNISAYFPAIPDMAYTFEGEGNEFASFTREIKYVEKPYLQVHENNGGTIIASVYKISNDEIVRIYQEGEFYSDTNLIPGIEEKEAKREVLLKTPVEEGTTWENAEWKREIVGVDQNLTVPAGTFSGVIQIKITSKKQDSSSEMVEYYAENVGLISREFRSEGSVVTSKLKSYGMRTGVVENPQQTTGEDEASVVLVNPDLPLLAYQLEHQIRSAFQAAYESYINLAKVAQYNDQNFEQILKTYRKNLTPLAVESLVNAHVERLRQYYQAGEGEVTFPAYEVIDQAKLLDKTVQTAKVGISIHKFFPAREWSGKAYDQVSDYIIHLAKVDGNWKVEKVNVAE